MLDALDVDQLAAALRCAPETVREAAAEGRLPAVKFGRDWIFPRAALEEALNQQARDGAELRSKKPEPAAVLQQVAGAQKKRRPPALPTGALPGLHLAATRTEGPSASKSSP